MRWHVSTVFSAFFLLGGCAAAPLPAPSHVEPLGGHLSKSQVYVEQADVNVKSAKPHADPAGQGLLDAATKNHVQATAELAGAQDELKHVNDDYSRAVNENVTLQAQVSAYHKRWVGDRTFSLLRWIIVIALTAWFGLGIAGAALNGALPGLWLGTLGKQVLHLLPVANPFGWMASWLKKKVAVVSPVQPVTAFTASPAGFSHAAIASASPPNVVTSPLQPGTLLSTAFGG